MASKLYRHLRFGTHLYSECLDPYWFSSWSSGGQKHSEADVSGAPSQRKVFGTFYIPVLRNQFETWYLAGSATHQVRVSSQSGYSGLLYSQKWVKVIFVIYGLKNFIIAFRFGTYSYIASVLNLTAFCHVCAMFGPLVATNTQKGDLSRAPRHRKVFWAFFHMFWDMNLKSGVHIR